MLPVMRNNNRERVSVAQCESKVTDILLIGEVSVPSSDDVAIHLGVF